MVGHFGDALSAQPSLPLGQYSEEGQARRTNADRLRERERERESKRKRDGIRRNVT